jgi:hypothetical protein
MAGQATLDLGAPRAIFTESAGDRVILRIVDPRREDHGFRLELTAREADKLAGDLCAEATQVINRMRGSAEAADAA